VAKIAGHYLGSPERRWPEFPHAPHPPAESDLQKIALGPHPQPPIRQGHQPMSKLARPAFPDNKFFQLSPLSPSIIYKNSPADTRALHAILMPDEAEADIITALITN
jgi:hypothetical protein